MRVLFVIHQFMPEYSAGTEMVTLGLARSAQQGGHTAEILTTSIRDPSLYKRDEATGLLRTMHQGIAVYALDEDPRPPPILEDFGFGQRPERAERVRGFLDRRPRFDVVHAMHGMRMLEALAVIRERRIPYILTLTDFFLDCYHITLTRSSGELCGGPAGGEQCVRSCPVGDGRAAILQRLDATSAVLDGAVSINACSDYIANVFRREHPHLAVRVVPHGINLLRFDYRLRHERKRLGVVGFLGTISEAKGVHVLAEAFLRSTLEGVTLRIVGPCYDDAFMDRLRSITGGSERVEILAPVNAGDVPATLGDFDLLCLPSLWPETFSLVVHEGFAAGVPCLVSDVGAPADTVRTYRCGEVVPVGSVEGWTAHFDRLAQDPMLLKVWRSNVPLPRRLEEEGFLYDQLYRQAIFRAQSRSVTAAGTVSQDA